MLFECSAAKVNDKWLLELGSHVNEYCWRGDAKHRNDQVVVLLGSNIYLVPIGSYSTTFGGSMHAMLKQNDAQGDRSR